MALARIDISNVRNLRQLRLESLGAVNVFFGANGSGKTSILEAIHLLGMARSFRSSNARTLITHGQPRCTVFGEVLGGDSVPISMGVQRELEGDVQIKIAGEPVRVVSQLVEQLPLQLINAASFDLLTGAPAARRQYLDWGVFHVEHRFFAQWQRFQRCIKQRNKLLRRGKMADCELAAWTRELIEAGEEITRFRRAYYEQLQPRFNGIVEEISPSLEGLELRYRQGWDKSQCYGDALEASMAADLEQGYTHVGPQRADIRVYAGAHLAADTLSRGQQKLVVCALKLAQGQLMSRTQGRPCIYLVDDLPSELDFRHSSRVCEKLGSMGAQVFITCVDRNDITAAWPEGADLRMFHVEHGQIRAA